MQIKRRIAAATLALALAVGGIVGIAATDLDDPSSQGTEQAGATWSFTGFGDTGQVGFGRRIDCVEISTAVRFHEFATNEQVILVFDRHVVGTFRCGRILPAIMKSEF